MAFCVLMHRSDSVFKDILAEHYQFPSSYLSRLEPSVGDWIVYLEPTKVPHTRGYFAVAKVEKIVPDPKEKGMYLALLEPGSYLDFSNPVPFRDEAGEVLERGLLNERGIVSGRAQAAVRPISAQDFDRILERGLNEARPLLPRSGDTPALPYGLSEEQTPFAHERPLTRVATLTSRLVRDRVFRRVVLRAYDERCAVSGLKLINGGGRAEVDAAHIKPVAAGGPDIASNGIALSGTAHWMFDRGLISLSDDLNILISRQVNDPESVRGFINDNGRAYAPSLSSSHPHPHFLAWHRERCFKQ